MGAGPVVPTRAYPVFARRELPVAAGGEHLRLKGLAQKIAYPAKLLFGPGDQRLIDHLVQPRVVLCLRQDLAIGLSPKQRPFSHVEAAEAADERCAQPPRRHLVGDPRRAQMRSHHVAWIAPDDQDAGLREPVEDPPEIKKVAGRLFADPTLAGHLAVGG